MASTQLILIAIKCLINYHLFFREVEKNITIERYVTCFQLFAQFVITVNKFESKQYV